MQHHDNVNSKTIAEEAKKDGSAMKSLALVTTIFLPTTAIAVSALRAFFPICDWHGSGGKSTSLGAMNFVIRRRYNWADPSQTIFSVTSFYQPTSDQSDRLVVSNQFWIFWAVAAPFTFFVVILWSMWINRKQMVEFRDEHIPSFSGKNTEPKGGHALLSSSRPRPRHRSSQSWVDGNRADQAARCCADE